MRDLIVIGGGPGGLGAACGARDAGLKDILVVERDFRAGGILNQCIHDGFGLVRYHDALTGPEYAGRSLQEAASPEIEIMTDTIATAITFENGEKTVHLQSPKGLEKVTAKSIVLATGCRERTRGALAIPGERPAGILTAGAVQKLINIHNILPGRKAVILGSGDIGLIMARRLTLEGAEVSAVLELNPFSGGLARNIRQCLQDFRIPVRIRETVVEIRGRNRLSSIVAAKVDEKGTPIPGTEYEIPCDLLILSVGLIPENEVAREAGIALEDRTNNVITDAFLQTNRPGIFSCGNSRKVHDLADYVTGEGVLAGKNAAAYVLGKTPEAYDEKKNDAVEKGIPDEKEMFCINCPRGCRLTAETDASGNVTVSGNKCGRGILFAKQEMISPMRTVTTTIKDSAGNLIPVKSTAPVELKRLREFTEACRKISVREGELHDGEVLSVEGFEAGIRAAVS